MAGRSHGWWKTDIVTWKNETCLVLEHTGSYIHKVRYEISYWILKTFTYQFHPKRLLLLGLRPKKCPWPFRWKMDHINKGFEAFDIYEWAVCRVRVKNYVWKFLKIVLLLKEFSCKQPSFISEQIKSILISDSRIYFQNLVPM